MNVVKDASLLYILDAHLSKWRACNRFKMKRVQIESPVCRITQLLQLAHNKMISKNQYVDTR